MEEKEEEEEVSVVGPGAGVHGAGSCSFPARPASLQPVASLSLVAAWRSQEWKFIRWAGSQWVCDEGGCHRLSLRYR